MAFMKNDLSGKIKVFYDSVLFSGKQSQGSGRQYYFASCRHTSIAAEVRLDKEEVVMIFLSRVIIEMSNSFLSVLLREHTIPHCVPYVVRISFKLTHYPKIIHPVNVTNS
jgi:hypothetical protein